MVTNLLFLDYKEARTNIAALHSLARLAGLIILSDDILIPDILYFLCPQELDLLLSSVPHGI